MTDGVEGELARLVRFDTTSHLPTLPLVGYLEERLRRLGARTERVERRPGKVSLLAHMGPASSDGGLTLSGHLDVVPVDGQPWTSDPFRLTERADRLVGRGTADMKGFLAAALTALDARPTLRRPLSMVWTCDEEVGCLGSAEVVDDLHQRGASLPRACLIGEPTGFAVMRMHPGHIQVDVEIEGRAAHSSHPELGDNAIHKAADLVIALRGLSEQLRAERDDTLPLDRPWVALNVGRIEGGVAVNVVPDACRVTVGLRPLPGHDASAVLRRVEALLPPGARAHVHHAAIVPALDTPPGTPLAGWLAPFAEPGPIAVPFATDGGNLARAGLAPIVFGPGRIEVAHRADEHVLRADLHRAVDVIGQLMHRACGAA